MKDGRPEPAWHPMVAVIDRSIQTCAAGRCIDCPGLEWMREQPSDATDRQYQAAS